MKRGMVAVVAGVALVLSLGLCACSAQKPDSSSGTQAVSTMVESTYEGVLQATNIDLPAPKDATNVQYFYYKEKNPIAEMRFTLDGKEACLRAQSTALTAFPYEGDALVKAVAEGKNLENGTDISGMYYKWDTFSSQDVQYCNAQCFRAGDVGYIAWIDVVPGYLYNLMMQSGATDETLVKMAEAAFTPMQGDRG